MPCEHRNIMDREEILDYILVAAENRIRQRLKYCIEKDYLAKQMKQEIEYYDKVVEYVRKNLK
jgi:hypothetical protein